MSKKVSAFLLSHGSINANYVSKRIDSGTNGDIYDFSVDCQDLPKNTRLCMPNILGKPYYENRVNMIGFINSKIKEWNSRPQPAAVPEKESSKRPRQSEPNSFSDFIAETLTRFEEVETAEMFDLMDERP